MLKFLPSPLLALLSASAIAAIPPIVNAQQPITKVLEKIEKEHNLKIGIYAFDTNNNKSIEYRADERFPVQSTFKFIAVSALLSKNPPLLEKDVKIHNRELTYWSHISGKYVGKEVSLKILAEGAMTYSDNTAINKIINELGGLKTINEFAHNHGNKSFNMTHYEVNLNSNPNKIDDTSTPKDMAKIINKVLLGDILTTDNKQLLIRWMRDNTTGYNRIRAGVPVGWSVADKTGSGSFGVANDVGIAWSPYCKPIILSIYTVGTNFNDEPEDIVISEVTKALFDNFSKYHICYNSNS